MKKISIISKGIARTDTTSSDLRMYYITKAFVQMGADVTFYYFKDDKNLVNKIDGVNFIRLDKKPHNNIDTILSIPSDVYWLTNIWTPDYLSSLSKFVDDVVGSKIIIDTMDLHANKWHRKYEYTQEQNDLNRAKKFERIEKEFYKKANTVIVVTEEERKKVLSLINNVNVDVIPNIHEVYYNIPSYNDRKGIVFLGNFNVQHNIDAVNYFINAIHPYCPGITFHVIGEYSDEKIPSSGNVISHGYMKYLKNFLSTFRLSVCPMTYGAGMKGKIGECLSCGLPVVTTSIGAEGFNFAHGEDCFISDNPIKFAKYVQQLYDDVDLWTKFSNRGIEKIRSQFSPEIVNKKVEKIIYE